MNANEVIRPNSECTYWDVPGFPGRMVHSYRIHGTDLWEIEVIEPTNSGLLDCDYQTITFLDKVGSDKTELYGVLSTKKTDNRAEQNAECYRTIAECFTWQTLLDLGTPKLVMGRIELWADNKEAVA